MPDGGDVGEGSRRLSIQRLERHIRFLAPEAKALSRGQLTGYGAHRPAAGWRVTIQFSDTEEREFDIVVDGAFPHSPPLIFLRSPPPLLTWPHIEEDGRLCLVPDHHAFGREDACSVLDMLLGMACDLVPELARGERDADLQNEFLSYWSRFVRPDARRVVSLLQPQGPTRQIHVQPCRGDLIVVADEAAELVSWLERGGMAKLPKSWRGVLAWLPAPPMPSDYPKTATALLSLLQRQAPEASELVRHMSVEAPPYLTVVLASEVPNGPCFAAVTLQPRILATVPGRQPSNPMLKGFRKGKVPAGIIRDRHIGCCTVTASKVERADHGWVHGRGRDHRVVTLRGARVAVIGCGSVGGAVAMRLAEAGVGHIFLVDADRLASANVGRHVLGMNRLFKSKAPALAADILARFPHMGSVRSAVTRCQDMLQEDGSALAPFDLIVSAMGDWPGEASLNDWHIAGGRKMPVLYTWTEAHACAGHAVLVSSRGGCLRCGMDDRLRPRLQVTQWPNGVSTLQSEPACGAAFQPYGPVELTYITTMAAEMALDALLAPSDISINRVWAAPRRRLEASGGKWTEQWLGGGSGRDIGGALHEIEWPAVACTACSRSP